MTKSQLGRYVVVSAGEYSVFNQVGKSNQDYWLRPGASAHSGLRHEGAVRNSGIHGSRGRTVRTNTLRHGHVECRHHLLRTVCQRTCFLHVIYICLNRTPKVVDLPVNYDGSCLLVLLSDRFLPFLSPINLPVTLSNRDVSNFVHIIVFFGSMLCELCLLRSRAMLIDTLQSVWTVTVHGWWWRWDTGQRDTRSIQLRLRRVRRCNWRR